MSELEDKKAAALEAAFDSINKQFGKGSIITGQGVPGIEFVSSGSKSLDGALGGGYPKGRIIEIYGPESSGKTTLALHAVAQIQKQGGKAAFIDAEHALDVKYAGNLGVDVDELIISQPDSGEQALEILEALARSGAVDIAVVDSVAALVPQSELDGDMGAPQMGIQARLMSQAMRKLAGVCHKTGMIIIFINQLRMKIGVMFGNPETTSGGNALKFYASQRLDVRRSGTLKDGTGDDAEIVGNETRVKVIKNKVFPPYREAEFLIRYGVGIDKEADILEMAVTKGVIEVSGTWYSYGKNKLGQGKAKTIAFLKENPEVLEEISSKV